MQAIEFKAIAKQQMLRIPENIPDGTQLRVLLLLDDVEESQKNKVRRKPSKKLIGSVTMSDDLTAPAVSANEWDVLS